MTIRRILIANRGEIAVRIARTARRLGIETIAVLSDSDAGAAFADACDQVARIGGVTPAESYLVPEKILAAARATGADAIHPGYGFLSENAGFAAAVAEAGLVWIGPPPAAIEVMGDKANSRTRAIEAGLPVATGYEGDDQSLERFTAEAERIGYPVMIKASAGGGGRGMRLIHAREDLAGGIASAASEAAKAFGNARLLLEKAIIRPRHVEIQIFADSHGNAVHLFERDCSVQRRHQKVIEEAPSPALDPGLREQMGEAAVRIAREIGYAGAGTVEFLLDESGQFYFMEMNTRLQVEHPVTELITGLDLVEWQIRVAEGGKLPARQDEICLDGWAIEARLCAEDPAADYVPCTGKVLAWQTSPRARTDHGLAAGMEVKPYFDSMLGKVIVHAPTREEACERLRAALDDTVLLGVPSNRHLLAAIAANPVFAEGRKVSTAFLAEQFGNPASRAARPEPADWAIAALLAVVGSAERVDIPAEWRDWSSTELLETPVSLQVTGSGDPLKQRATVRLVPGGAQVTIDGATRCISGEVGAAGQRVTLEVDGSLYRVVHARDGDDLWLWVNPLGGGTAREFRAANLLRQAPDVDGGKADDRHVASPMNGTVVALHVAPGDMVTRGQILVVVEAMKMEHALVARIEGRVVAVSTARGEQVPPRRLLVEIEPLGD